MDANFETKIATVVMMPGKTLTKADCEKAFEGTNYSVASFE